ncbi:acyltransferase family protein [Burkholderia sp. MR1-5-21]
MGKTNLSLEGLRGAAALLVVVFHMFLAMHQLWFGLARNGYLAVDLFFVLSGFVICSAYGRRLDSAAESRIFILRRFGRLYPVFIVTTLMHYAVYNSVVALLARSGHYYAPEIPTPAELLSLGTMTQALNLFDHYVGNGSAWSTSDEFYVYLLFCLMCITLRGKARLAAFAGFAIAGYGVAVWAAVYLGKCLTHGECFTSTISFGWARCIAGFFAGALVAEFRNIGTFRALRGNVAQLATLAIAVAFVIYADRLPGLACAAPLVFAPLIASLADDRGPVAALLNMRPFQYLGRISYSLYLTHAVFCLAFDSIESARDTFVGRAAAAAGFLFVCFGIAHIICEVIEIPCRARFYAWSARLSGSGPRSAAQG